MLGMGQKSAVIRVDMIYRITFSSSHAYDANFAEWEGLNFLKMA